MIDKGELGEAHPAYWAPSVAVGRRVRRDCSKSSGYFVDHYGLATRLPLPEAARSLGRLSHPRRGALFSFG